MILPKLRPTAVPYVNLCFVYCVLNVLCYFAECVEYVIDVDVFIHVCYIFYTKRTHHSTPSTVTLEVDHRNTCFVNCTFQYEVKVHPAGSRHLSVSTTTHSTNICDVTCTLRIVMHLKSLHGLYSDSLLEKRESIVWKLVVSCCYLLSCGQITRERSSLMLKDELV